MDSLWQPVSRHGSNKLIVGLLAALAIGLVNLAWLDQNQQADWRDEFAIRLGVAILLSIAALLAVAAVWIGFRRAVVDSEELTCRSLFGEKRMRWDQVQRFYYRAEKPRIIFFLLSIPLPTYYSFILVDSHGQKLRFGTALSKPALLASELIERTQPYLLPAATSLFSSGADVDFGPIRVNRCHGITVAKWHGRRKQIRWSEIYSHGIQDGQFYIWCIGDKEIDGVPVARIPNVFVLQSLLDLARSLQL